MSGDGGQPHRFNREAFNRELDELDRALKGPTVSAPMTASDLYELERLIRKYPDEAQRLLAAHRDDR
jgi:hypothetical protein